MLFKTKQLEFPITNDYTMSIVDSVLEEIYSDAKSKEDEPLQVATLIIADKIRAKFGLDGINSPLIEQLYSSIIKTNNRMDNIVETVVEVKDKLNNLELTKD